MELSGKELVLLSHFRRNARESLTKISRVTRVPVSTIYDKLKHYEMDFVRKHTTLIDFTKLGFMTRANVMLKVSMDDRNALRDYLLKHEHVNSLFKVNNGYDYLAELVFKHIKDLEDFLETVEMKYSIGAKMVFYVIEDLCREEFMAKPELVKMEVLAEEKML